MWGFYTGILPYRKFKPFTKMMFKHFNGRKDLIGCEVGVAKGINARSMLYGLLRNGITVKKMYLVDPYKEYKDTVMDEGVVTIDAEKNWKFAQRYLSAYRDIVEWRLLESKSAIHFIHDKLDFCYIDANHQYDFVKKDIDLYYPLMNKNGMFGGHDYAVNYPDIRKAVNEFITENKLKLEGYEDDWVVKT